MPCRRKLAIFFVSGIATSIVLGYLSSGISVAACQRATVSDLGAFIAAGSPPRSVSWLSRPDVSDRLLNHPEYRRDLAPEYRRRSYLIQLRLLVPNREPQLPWAYAFTEPTPWPFVVRSDYGTHVRSLYGRCSTRLFVTFFGFHQELLNWEMLWW